MSLMLIGTLELRLLCRPLSWCRFWCLNPGRLSLAEDRWRRRHISGGTEFRRRNRRWPRDGFLGRRSGPCFPQLFYWVESREDCELIHSEMVSRRPGFSWRWCSVSALWTRWKKRSGFAGDGLRPVLRRCCRLRTGTRGGCDSMFCACLSGEQDSKVCCPFCRRPYHYVEIAECSKLPLHWWCSKVALGK